MMLNVTMSE